jgi:hypothetical protein
MSHLFAKRRRDFLAPHLGQRPNDCVIARFSWGTLAA